MDFANFFFIFLVKNSRFANMKKLFHFMHLEIWTKVPSQSQCERDSDARDSAQGSAPAVPKGTKRHDVE